MNTVAAKQGGSLRPVVAVPPARSALGAGEVAVAGGDRDAVSGSVGAYAPHTA